MTSKCAETFSFYEYLPPKGSKVLSLECLRPQVLNRELVR